jgi:hypothetical protein
MTASVGTSERGESPVTNETEMINVVLVGGPSWLPRELQPRRLPGGTEKVKLPYGGRYEHFERTPVTAAGDGPVVFQWTGSTRVAE